MSVNIASYAVDSTFYISHISLCPFGSMINFHVEPVIIWILSVLCFIHHSITESIIGISVMNCQSTWLQI